jgi:gluconate 2-dehydrogenase gamma chain
MNRREFLECAAVLVSGAAISKFANALSEEQMVHLASAPPFSSRSVDYFTLEQRQLVAAIAEAIIPRTDTPGAIEVGVPHFIELMVAYWLNDEERTIFNAGLKDMATRIPKEYGKSFEQLSSEQQLAILSAMEDAASDSPWYAQGNIRRAFVSDAPFICQMKELTIWGFFTSEVGATKVLQYNVMPMHFDGHAPRTPGETTWAPFNFYH